MHDAHHGRPQWGDRASPTPSDESSSKTDSSKTSSSSKRSREKDEFEDRYPSPKCFELNDEDCTGGFSNIMEISPRSIDKAASLDFVCENCGEKYNANNDNEIDACYWASNTHKGRFVVNHQSEFWADWESKTMGSPISASSRFGMDGGFEWTICGCDNNGSECIRIGQHKVIFRSNLQIKEA
jgi:hypothetical protein